jgi:ketosteroid isomerase-like protein
MSQENVEVVRQLYEAVNAQRWGTNRALYDPDYEADLRDGGVGVIRGVEAAETTLREYWETFENFHVELREVIHADDQQVVTAVRDGGRLKGSDAEVWNRFFHVWAFPQRQGPPSLRAHRPGPGPRSRRSFGVGDVAGARHQGRA